MQAKATMAIFPLLASITGCSGELKKRVEKPVSVVSFGKFRLSDELQKRASHVFVSDSAIGFTLCDGPRRTCPPAYAIANDGGVRVILWVPRTGASLYPIGEKPMAGKHPHDVPLISLPANLVAPCCKRDTNWWSMSRLQPTFKSKDAFLTTASKWPVVSCDKNYAVCTMGFSVDSAFAEASFSLNRPAALSDTTFPSQSDLWALGAAVDAQIRAFSIPARSPS